MIRVQLKYLHSPDVFDLQDYNPSDPENFRIIVQAMIGAVGENFEESFDFIVCTPKWLNESIGSQKYLFGRHHLLVTRYDYEVILKAITTLCTQVNDSDWQIVAQKLGRFGKWEFEDYSTFR